MSDALKELMELLNVTGVKIKFGLRAQGHIPTVERLLSEGKNWNEIGKAIGWHGDTARVFYEREKGREKP